MNSSLLLSPPRMNAGILFILVIAFMLIEQSACTRGYSCEGNSSDIIRPSSWTQESHCPGVEPNYNEVFDDQVVHKIDIVISKENYEATLKDMDEKYSGGGVSADLDELPKPMWIPATINYKGMTWTQVGMRYKGHSSLKAAWQGGIRKLSFILNFDYYEDLYPDLNNQRFFGFNKLSFSNAFNDPSLIREKLAANIFRAGGVPAAQSSFAAVYMDWGEGPIYLGLYTIVEDPCDNMLKTQVGDGSGNLYKPWGNAARWRSLEKISQDDIKTHFETCKSDEDIDNSDVIAAINALHADRSTPENWRTNLETVFDVPSFIKTLALNQVMMNWDSYGCMHHNYFVYANPLNNGSFLWFPWDLNESMLYRKQSSCPEPGSVLLDEIVYADANTESKIDTDWPLIQFILADPVYREAYKNELRVALDGAFAANSVITQMERYHDLIAPYIVGPKEVEAYPYTNCTQDGFKNSLTSGNNALKPHVDARHAAVKAALGIN